MDNRGTASGTPEPSAPSPSSTGEGEALHARCGVGLPPEPPAGSPDGVREVGPTRSQSPAQPSARPATRTDYFDRYRLNDGTIDWRRWAIEHAEPLREDGNL